MGLFKHFEEKKNDAAQTEAGGATAETAQADATAAHVQAIIDQLRPYLQADGGDVELLKVEDNAVYVRLVGACAGCPSSLMTLRAGIEARIKEEVPEIISVEMV